MEDSSRETANGSTISIESDIAVSFCLLIKRRSQKMTILFIVIEAIYNEQMLNSRVRFYLMIIIIMRMPFICLMSDSEGLGKSSAF